MNTYLLKRLLLILPTLVGMTLLTYGIVRLAPGDPIEAMIRNQSGNIDPKAMRESADRIRERLGLNYINYWGDDVESLLPALKSEDASARKHAAGELKRITGRDISHTREAWQAWSDRERAASGRIESLLADLREGDEKARTKAAADLREIAGQDLTPEQWAARLASQRKTVVDAEPLLGDLKNGDDPARAKAGEELRRLTGLDFTEDYDAWQAWWGVSKYTFGNTLIDPAEKVVNVFHGYGRWVAHMFQGDFGESIVYRMPRNSPIVGYLSGLRNWAWGIDGDAIEKQIAGLKSPKEGARAKAVEELRRITGQHFAEKADDWQKWWDGSRKQRWAASWWAGLDELRANGSKNPFWIILDRIPVTFTLNVIAEILIFAIAIPVGLAAARHQGKWFDRGSSVVLLGLWSVPAILAGSLLLAFLAKGGLGPWWFPVSGLHAQDYEKLPWGPFVLDLLWHATLPVACMVYGGFAYLAKLGRASLLENLRADFVRTARAKGLSERRVVYHHALRNSLLPMITATVLALPGLLGGSVVVERIFSIQGTGQLLIGAAEAFDLSVIMAEVLLYGFLTLFFLVIGDLLYAWADPRIRYE